MIVRANIKVDDLDFFLSFISNEYWHNNSNKPLIESWSAKIVKDHLEVEIKTPNPFSGINMLLSPYAMEMAIDTYPGFNTVK